MRDESERRRKTGASDALLKAGHVWVVDTDLKSYFDTIPHDRSRRL